MSRWSAVMMMMKEKNRILARDLQNELDSGPELSEAEGGKPGQFLDELQTWAAKHRIPFDAIDEFNKILKKHY